MLKKILIIRFSSIGDIVLTTPVIRCLRSQLNAEVHYLTKPAFADIVFNNPYVSKVITLSDQIESTITMLKEENYDHIIDLHHNLRSGRIKLALKRPSTSFSKLNFEKWLIVNFKIDRLPQKHIVDRYFEAIENLNCKNDQKGLDFIIPAEKHINIAQQFGDQFTIYVSIVIGAAHETKCMTAEQIIELCRKLNMPVVLLGGKKEIAKANLIMENLKSSHVKSACGQLDIFQSASILNQSSVIITHDTGMMHIAAALKKPQIVVWGNTIPEFGMTPYYGAENVVWHSFEILGLKCRPCSKLGYEKCPKGHFKCMLDHDLPAIVENAKLHLEN